MLVLIVIAIVLWIYFVWSRRELYWLSWKMPGPSAPIPIVGNIMGMWNEEGKHGRRRPPDPRTHQRQPAAAHRNKPTRFRTVSVSIVLCHCVCFVGR